MNFFTTYFTGRLVDKFISIEELSSITGRTRAFLVEEAKHRKFEIWFQVPEDVEIRIFPVTGILNSDIRADLDYLTIAPQFSDQDYSSFYNEKTHYMVNAGTLLPMDLLLISFQDLRWNAKDSFCIFPKGIQYREIEENSSSPMKHYDQYDGMRDQIQPKVFVTVKKGNKEYRLTEDRVVRLSIDNMIAFIPSYLASSYVSEMEQEFMDIRAIMLSLLDLDDICFINFPEKLFYVFVVMYRNINETKLSSKINRKKVLNELILFGIHDRLAHDFATLIINELVKNKGDRQHYRRLAMEDVVTTLGKLKAIGLFHAFKKFYISNANMRASDITEYLTSNFNYADEVARKVSPIIVGTDKDGSWKYLRKNLNQASLNNLY
ncbi:MULTISPECIES: hypothetical protein [unclassified Neptuniibacter]|uniref:hypothetical protein n=1 Tax=unclassified Neptuniibacter TaxID=2630693 RepID=UPI000C5CA549|nr:MULTISPECIES: hypothetical protein [unclassified Neptuniibacter]MAY43457.1 hypothetical protein [Oceanospirillaceae bacterium]|tara:strand:+ start:793 stop:1926 length:1134 start_codon:yes stop_codon:yes gene_type:complete